MCTCKSEGMLVRLVLWVSYYTVSKSLYVFEFDSEKAMLY